MLEAYYGLNGRPFDKSCKIDELFLSKSMNELLSRLEYMKQCRGIMLITGAPGAGKTTALRFFAGKLSPLSYKYFYIPLSTVNVLDFYRQLNRSIGGEPFHFKSRLFNSIQSRIRDMAVNSKIIPVLIFDEAHLLKNENFQELQMLSNFSMDSADPAIIIIAGQPHLAERLMRPVLISFHQRIVLKFHLDPLEKEEILPFVSHILSARGLYKSPFSEAAMEAMFKNTGGVPRLISSLALKTMTCGMLSRSQVLTEEHVFQAAREL